MPPGRKPKSAQERRAEGNAGHRPILEGVKVAPGIPPMPRGLPKAALVEWKRVTPLLKKQGILSHFDRSALADYCLCVSRLEECEKDISERGVLVKGDRGLVKNPALQVAREYRQALQRWAVEFGFTPGSRGRINVPETSEDDPEGLLD